MYPDPLKSTGREVLNFLQSKHFSLQIYEDVSPKLNKHGIQEIQITDYISTSHPTHDLREELWKWHKQLHRGILPKAYMSSGRAKDVEEATRMVQLYCEQVDELWKAAAVFPMGILSLVGREHQD
jgi:hypothetical protein